MTIYTDPGVYSLYMYISKYEKNNEKRKKQNHFNKKILVCVAALHVCFSMWMCVYCFIFSCVDLQVFVVLFRCWIVLWMHASALWGIEKF